MPEEDTNLHCIECAAGDKLTLITTTHVVICTVEMVRARRSTSVPAPGEDVAIRIHEDDSVPTGTGNSEN